MSLIYSIEDDDGILELLTCAFKTANMEFCGFYCFDEFLSAVKIKKPDLILLDVMLPDVDGFTILKHLKGKDDLKNIPVIMLTAKTKETDKVTGLDMGADDYISKPFGVFELLARVKAALRRSRPQLNEQSDNVLEGSNIELNIEKHTVKVGEEEINLTYKEFELLKYLMYNKNIVLNREKLLERVWGYDYSGETRTVDMHIKSLRQKLHDDSDNPKIIATIRGIGYKFIYSNMQ